LCVARLSTEGVFIRAIALYPHKFAYVQAGLKEPLVIWWLFVPGLNLIVGLRQIHFLSQFWARERGITLKDAIAENIPFLSANA
jgi:hypothetical protein